MSLHGGACLVAVAESLKAQCPLFNDRPHVEGGLLDLYTAGRSSNLRSRDDQYPVSLLEDLLWFGALLLEQVRRQVLAQCFPPSQRLGLERVGGRAPFNIVVKQREHGFEVTPAVGLVGAPNCRCAL